MSNKTVLTELSQLEENGFKLGNFVTSSLSFQQFQDLAQEKGRELGYKNPKVLIHAEWSKEAISSIKHTFGQRSEVLETAIQYWDKGSWDGMVYWHHVYFKEEPTVWVIDGDKFEQYRA